MKRHNSRRYTLTYILTTCLTLAVSDAIASPCVANKGSLPSPMDYGSAEQIKDLQTTLQSGCEVIGRTWSPLSGVRKFLVLDGNANVLARVTASQSGSPSWETWSDFTKRDVLNDDPADGFDLPNYSADNASAKSVVTPQIAETVKTLVSRIQ